MNLADYLSKNKLTAVSFAQKAGISEAAVSRYLAGTRMPTIPVAASMMLASDGAVDFHDHLDPKVARKIKAARK